MVGHQLAPARQHHLLNAAARNGVQPRTHRFAPCLARIRLQSERDDGAAAGRRGQGLPHEALHAPRVHRSQRVHLQQRPALVLDEHNFGQHELQTRECLEQLVGGSRVFRIEAVERKEDRRLQEGVEGGVGHGGGRGGNRAGHTGDRVKGTSGRGGACGRNRNAAGCGIHAGCVWRAAEHTRSAVCARCPGGCTGACGIACPFEFVLHVVERGQRNAAPQPQVAARADLVVIDELVGEPLLQGAERVHDVRRHRTRERVDFGHASSRSRSPSWGKPSSPTGKHCSTPPQQHHRRRQCALARSRQMVRSAARLLRHDRKRPMAATGAACGWLDGRPDRKRRLRRQARTEALPLPAATPPPQ